MVKPPSNWDPALLISQIVSLQALHYLTLSLLIPPLLHLFADPVALNYEGGASNVGMIMDWRELAGRPTVRGLRGAQRWDALTGVWSGGKHIGHHKFASGAWDGGVDPLRGWIIALCWFTAYGADVWFIYTLIRRPRMVLDFTLTLLFLHLVFTSYYSASVPTSFFFWMVMIIGAIGVIIIAEQLCVRREMRDGLAVPPTGPSPDDIEMQGLMNRDD